MFITVRLFNRHHPRPIEFAFECDTEQSVKAVGGFASLAVRAPGWERAEVWANREGVEKVEHVFYGKT